MTTEDESQVGVMRARIRFGALRWRLFAAFLAVAVGAVGLLALLDETGLQRVHRVSAADPLDRGHVPTVGPQSSSE